MEMRLDVRRSVSECSIYLHETRSTSQRGGAGRTGAHTRLMHAVNVCSSGDSRLAPAGAKGDTGSCSSRESEAKRVASLESVL